MIMRCTKYHFLSGKSCIPTIVLVQKMAVATARLVVKPRFGILLPDPTNPLSEDQILGCLSERGMEKESYHSIFWNHALSPLHFHKCTYSYGHGILALYLTPSAVITYPHSSWHFSHSRLCGGQQWHCDPSHSREEAAGIACCCYVSFRSGLWKLRPGGVQLRSRQPGEALLWSGRQSNVNKADCAVCWWLKNPTGSHAHARCYFQELKINL